MIPSGSNLNNIPRYLDRYPRNDQPAAFEYLVASSFSQIFHLTFQSKDNENNTINHRVIWYGNIDRKSKTISKSSFGPDSICFAYGFYIVIESTLKEGANQWRREFVEALRHYGDFVKNNNLGKKDVHLVIVVKRLHEDTYTGFKQKAIDGLNIAILEISHISKIWKTSKMVLTIKHLDLLQNLKEITRVLRESTSLKEYRNSLSKSISNWQREVFKREKTIFFGLKSLEEMKKTKRNIVGTSDILPNLQKDSKVKNYVKILGGGDLTNYIKEGLLSERLAYLITTPDEDLFCKINKNDFSALSQRVINVVEEING